MSKTDVLGNPLWAGLWITDGVQYGNIYRVNGQEKAAGIAPTGLKLSAENGDDATEEYGGWQSFWPVGGGLRRDAGDGRRKMNLTTIDNPSNPS